MATRRKTSRPRIIGGVSLRKGRGPQLLYPPQGEAAEAGPLAITDDAGVCVTDDSDVSVTEDE